MAQPSLFSTSESKAIKESWATLTKGGKTPVGKAILLRLLNDVREVRPLFKGVGVTEDTSTELTLEDLTKNEKFNSHAENLANSVDTLVENLDNTELIVQKCTELGEVHAYHRVTAEHFDQLGPVLVNVLCQALDVTSEHPAILAWIKAYGAISSTAKKGLAAVHQHT